MQIILFSFVKVSSFYREIKHTETAGTWFTISTVNDDDEDATVV